ncbi:MAG TPA: DnaJ domain-containing protein [Casimicrobiaceae bacterium]|nr:DnaJ domain-containing protein [Casimicrobiaceae bacterium]
MKATLYEALGILPTSSDEEVRAALRRVIRKYYAKTRDGQGNVEEALRFINHASRILSDPSRRTRYDQELSVSDGTTEQQIAHVVTNAMAEAGEQTDVSANSAKPAPEVEDLLGDDLDTGLPEEKRDFPFHHPGLTERVASFSRSPIVTVGLCALFGAFIAAAIIFVTPADAVLVAKQVLVWLTLTLVALTGIYGIVHGLAFLRRRTVVGQPALLPQTDLAILNWRREKSVFLGTNQPQEDASWIFQLRMAELERAKSGRTSEPRPWHRLAARLFDYAIWGLVLALLLSEVRASGMIPENLGYWLGHPLFAPILITGSFIPVEALLIAALGTTPGKWLFGVYLQFSISDAYARRDTRAQLERGFRRAFRVWWEGIGCGFPLLAPVLIAVAYEKVAQNQETDWDFAQDVLVTHGPAGVLNTVTGVCGLAAMLWLYGVAWHQPMAESIAWARTTLAEALPSPSRLTGGFAANAGRIGILSPPASTTPTDARANLPPAAAQLEAPKSATSVTTPSLDPDVTALMDERRARIAVLRVEGPRMLNAGNYRRASELCRAWTDLELASAEAQRCLGQALQAQGYYQDAINAFRKAKQYDPADRSLDVAIDRAQRGIVADFLNRYRR